MSRRLLRHVSALMTVVFYTVVIAPSAAMAQGFDFDEDEVDDFSEPMDFGDDEGFDADDWGDDSWEDDGWGEEPSTSTQPADDGVLRVPRDLAHRLEIAFGGDRKAGLDDVDAHFVQQGRDLELFVMGHGRAGALFAVPKRGVENKDAVLVGCNGHVRCLSCLS